MTIKKDENVLAGKKTPDVLPIETSITVTNANSLDIFGEVMK